MSRPRGDCVEAPSGQPGVKLVPRLDWRTHLKWVLVDLVTWPWQARQLRKAGFVRTGWRTWEYPG